MHYTYTVYAGLHRSIPENLTSAQLEKTSLRLQGFACSVPNKVLVVVHLRKAYMHVPATFSPACSVHVSPRYTATCCLATDYVSKALEDREVRQWKIPCCRRAAAGCVLKGSWELGVCYKLGCISGKCCKVL